MHSVINSITGRRVHYSATELKPAAQSILRSHHARFEHLFVNVLDRLSDPDRALLEGIVRSHIGQYNNHLVERDAGRLTDSELIILKRSIGVAMLSALCSSLESIEFEETAFCIIHNCRCHVSPRSNPAYKDWLWAEAAGNTCCPWSQMSSTASMWLDSATLPFLVPGRSENNSYFTVFGSCVF